MTKLISSILLLFILVTSGKSQDYDNAVGYRGGLTHGVTYKIFLDDESAFEALAGFRFRGVHFAIYKLKHQPANWRKSDKLFLYSGFGVHTGYYNRYDGNNFLSPFHAPYKVNKAYTVIGLDGVLGAEYRFLRYPFVVGADFNPFFDLFGPNYFNIHLGNFAFSLKYTF